MNYMFWGATLPDGMTQFPAGFGSKAENMSGMFWAATLKADIDWSGTAFVNLSDMEVEDMFGSTIWNNHTIKVKDAATKAKFVDDGGAPENRIIV
jgi:hypothetical protein